MEQNNKLGTMPIGRLLAVMSVPMMISFFIQALYNVVDSIFVAMISENALTAVSIAFPVQNIITAIGVGTGVGVNALVPRYLGQGRQKDAEKIANVAVFLSCCYTLVFLVVGLTLVGPYYRMQTGVGEIVELGIQYLSIVCVVSAGAFFGQNFEKLLVAKGELMGSAREIVAMAREQHVVVQEVDRARLDAMAPNHQGMIAVVSAYQYHTIEDIFALAAERKEEPFIVVLDGITDPHNLGAIIRSAECAGAHGVIIPSRRAVGLTPSAVKASAGAVEHIPVVRETNLSRTLESLKKDGCWVFGTAMDGKNYRNADYSGPVVLVIGSEGEGISKLVSEHCDDMVTIPLYGKIDSLNASVAAGIILFAIAEKRGAK